MKLTNRILMAGLSTALLLPFSSYAKADIQYTQETKMPSQGNGSFGSTTTYKRPGAERTETTYKFGAVEQKSIMLTLCAKKEIYTIDPALKLYYATPLISTTAAPRLAKAPAGKKTGTITMTLVSFKDMGLQTVGQYKTRCYEVVTRMQTSGCLGNMDTTTRQQICVAQGVNLASGDGCRDMTTSMNSGTGSDCVTNMVRKGNWAQYDKITRGLQVRTRIFSKASDAAPQMETSITKVSHAKLSPSLFAVPAGYRRVSQQEFQSAQSKAMMEKMSG